MRLKELRKAQRYSQKHIAEMAGIQQAAVCRLESGQYDPKLSVALKVARGLGVSISELMGEYNVTPASHDPGATP